MSKLVHLLDVIMDDGGLEKQEFEKRERARPVEVLHGAEGERERGREGEMEKGEMEKGVAVTPVESAQHRSALSALKG